MNYKENYSEILLKISGSKWNIAFINASINIENILVYVDSKDKEYFLDYLLTSEGIVVYFRSHL